GAAPRVPRAIPERHHSGAALGAAALHERQIGWAAERAADFQAYLRRKGERGAVVDGGWPLHAEAA
ncbi:3'-5' exonuclease, partial [Streptomyces albidoflavus]